MALLSKLLSQWNIDITSRQENQFDLYYKLLIEWNEKINLTSITDYDDVIVKHFVDSAALFRFADLEDKSILDVGTGAGFPGVVLKILCPSAKVTLLDSLNKRLVFLNEVISSLALDDICTVHGRAEDFAFNKDFRESFDYVTSRAVANLSTLSEYCVPFTKMNGVFVPYKSGTVDEELSSSKRAFSLLGCYVGSIERFNLPETDFDRSLVFIKKKNNTPKQYPRKAGTPAKSPL